MLDLQGGNVNACYVKEWVVVNNGAGYYKLHVNATDSNGTIQKYFWNDNQGWVDSTSIDSDQYQFRLSDINHATSFAIGARDDDGILTPHAFQVFPDSAPPKPAGLNAVLTTAQDSIRLMWGMMEDGKDSLNTLAKIEICYGTGCTPGTLLQDYVPLSQFGTINYGGTKRYFTFKKTQSGDMQWHVVFKDARGTLSASDPNSFTIP